MGDCFGMRLSPISKVMAFRVGFLKEMLGVRAQTGNERLPGSAVKRAEGWEVEIWDHSHLRIDQGGHRREEEKGEMGRGG